MEGMVTEIQRYSLYDGPGIRTTVFLKGCNMRCRWCHNPETLSMAPQLHVYPEKCIGCGRCVEKCVHGARGLRGGALYYDRARCVSCGACADVCFSGALMMSGRRMTPEQVMAEVEQDKDYYDRSGGGLTVSGGEALCQPDFLEALLRLSRAQGIQAAVETNLNYPRALLARFLPLLDLVMFDLKRMDDAAHLRLTGVSNMTILENAAWLLGKGVRSIVRTPVIPGATDGEENIRAVASFLSHYPSVEYYELLNYNPLGESKYVSLGMEYPLAGAKPLSAERMECLAETARQCGLRVKTR